MVDLVLLTHILDPNAEVAPYSRPQQITTRAGESYFGFILGKEGASQKYVGPDGKKFSIDKAEVALARTNARIRFIEPLKPRGIVPMPSTQKAPAQTYFIRRWSGKDLEEDYAGAL